MHSSESRGRPKTPTELDLPAYLLNAPFSYNTTIANNKWMEDYGSIGARAIDFDKAFLQWADLYSELAADGLVYILPTPINSQHQDLVFCGNLGIVLPHTNDPTVILSTFNSKPRRGEEIIGKTFFTMMGYTIDILPYFFEGEAELKHLRDNIYVGGYGQRSQVEAYGCMEEKYGMDILTLEEVDEYFYHLDCTVFPVTKSDTLVCTNMFTKKELSKLEKVTNVIDVSEDNCMQGITNSVRVGNTILNASNIHELKQTSDDFKLERAKNKRLEELAADLALEVKFVNLSEFLKGGALLSCMVMHLNRVSYSFSLV